MRMRRVFIGSAIAVLAGGAAWGEVELYSPGFPPSQVAENGTIIEPWGQVALCLEQPEGAALEGQTYDASAVPTVVTTVKAGPITLTQTAYRAPVWPSGADTLLARLVNDSDGDVETVLRVVLPEAMSIGERTGLVNGQLALALPADLTPIRKQRAWGCTGGVVPMPGWATPQGEYDPAFRNISAGMGGVPIIYRFSVPAGEGRRVALGFCESFWADAGHRPLEIRVEGAPTTDLDPLAAWGQHLPGCIQFDAADEDGDGLLEIVVAPHPRAQDRNPILNAIWVLPAGARPDDAAIIQGALSASAEYYVDVGGANDQLLYEGGELRYKITLGPKQDKELLFLLSSPGGGPVPNPEYMAWTPVSLRKAAEDVAAGWKQ